MKKLSKADIAKRDKFAAEIDELRSSLESTLTIFNAAVSNAFTPVLAATEELNAKIEEVGGWRDDLVGEMQSYYDERSEKWQESDAASEYDSWKSEFESLDCDAISIDEPEAIELPDALEGQNLLDLPEAVG